jgi:hypothetical protein
MAIMYAYFDESGKKSDHPVVTLSGVCLSQEKLQRFDDAWNTLLRQYGLPWLHMVKAAKLGVKVCEKMHNKQTASERTDALIPFADCINEHFEYGFLQAMDVHGFASMSKKAKYGLGDTCDPYYMAFTRAVLELLEYLQSDDRLSLICDDDMETAPSCYMHYRALRRVHPAAREKTVCLSFADDKYFPALQAADMVAYLSRLEARSRFYPGDRYSFRRLFSHLTKQRGVGFITWKMMFADKAMLKLLSEKLEKITRR